MDSLSHQWERVGGRRELIATLTPFLLIRYKPQMSPKKRVVSGVRPTGKLHLGHLHGILTNWIRLQDEYDCFFFVADWHGLTTEYEDPQILADSSREVVADWLAAGIDPDKATIFLQSDVKEHAELALLLSMITPLGWLERVPSYKDIIQSQTGKDLATHGFLGYPVLQTADVLLYQANCVPVGHDQVPHIELSREIARRFNHLYRQAAKGKDLFIEPQPLLTESPKILGPDRRKMSKSYDNCLYLADPPAVLQKKIASAITDPARKRRDDPGDPDVCLIFDYHKIYSDAARIEDINQRCRKAGLGCVDCKKMIADSLVDSLQEHQEKRAHFLKNADELDGILAEGAQRARQVATETMDAVRRVMKVH
jgi:tryptophanyl-tRNA synthetase